MVPSADVLIVTATRVESKAVLDAFAELTGQTDRIVTKNHRTYRDLGAVGDTRVFLALTEMGSGGLGASQQAVQKGIEALRPGAVLLVGIAFGVDEKKRRIGDILISQQLQLYDLQRVGANHNLLRGDKPHASPRLIDHFRQADLDWDESKAKVEFGLILTGEKLVDNHDYGSNSSGWRRKLSAARWKGRACTSLARTPKSTGSWSRPSATGRTAKRSATRPPASGWPPATPPRSWRTLYDKPR